MSEDASELLRIARMTGSELKETLSAAQRTLYDVGVRIGETLSACLRAYGDDFLLSDYGVEMQTEWKEIQDLVAALERSFLEDEISQMAELADSASDIEQPRQRPRPNRGGRKASRAKHLLRYYPVGFQ